MNSCFGRVWGQDNLTRSGPVRAIVKRLRRKLGDDADDPAYIFTKRWVGYWMEKGRRGAGGEFLTSGRIVPGDGLCARNGFFPLPLIC